MLAFLKRCYEGVKAFVISFIVNKPKESIKPPINLSRIIIKESPPPYQDIKTRPAWVNGLFDDYIKGKIPSLTHLRRAISTQEASSKLSTRNTL